MYLLRLLLGARIKLFETVDNSVKTKLPFLSQRIQWFGALSVFFGSTFSACWIFGQQYKPNLTGTDFGPDHATLTVNAKWQ